EPEAVESHTVLEDRAGGIVIAALHAEIGVAALQIDERRGRHGEAGPCADIEVAAGIEAEAVAGNVDVMAGNVGARAAIFALDADHGPAELDIIADRRAIA